MRKTTLLLLALFSSSIVLGNDAMLIGGRPAQEGEYPEVVKIRYSTSSCSAAVVGPRAILSAGHCMPDGGVISYQIGQVLYQATCKHTAQYKASDYHHDMAICKSDKAMDVRYAHIAKEGPALGDVSTLIGYGCNNRGGGEGYGVLRVGEAPVVELPKDNYWFFTRGSSTLCFGDSGGPAFKEVKDAFKETHYIQGVNSRGDIKELALLTSTTMAESQKFLQEYASANSLEICGVNSDCAKEEEQKPKPDPEPKRKCRRKYRKMVHYLGKYEKHKTKFEACQDRELL